MTLRRMAFQYGLAVFCALLWLFACQVIPASADCGAPQSVSLDPANWTRDAEYSGDFTSSGEYLKVYGAAWTNGCNFGPCDGNLLTTDDAYNLQGGELRVQFQAHGAGEYMGVTASFLPVLYTTYVTTHHSWDNSLLIPENTDLYLRQSIGEDKTWTWTLAQGDYDDQGGTVLDDRSGTLSDTGWENAAATSIRVAFLDNYAGTDAYILVKEMQVCTADGGEEPASGSGDVNGDVNISALDAAMVLQIISGALSPTMEQESAADVDGDGAVTQADADVILNWAAQGGGLNSPYVADVDLPAQETASTTVGPDGGTVSLLSGAVLDIPAGGLDQDTEITLELVDDVTIDSLGNMTMWRVKPDLSSVHDMTLTIPGADTAAAGANGYDIVERRWMQIPLDHSMQDQQTVISLDGMAQSQNTARNVQRGAWSSLSTSSWYVFAIDSMNLYIESTESSKVLTTPYYHQGAMEYCWSSSLCMVLDRCMVPDVALYMPKPWHPPSVGRIVPYGDESGLDMNPFNANTDLLDTIVEDYIGVTPIHGQWAPTNALELIRYIKKQIMDENRPVWLSLTTKGSSSSHIVVVVGYENDGGVISLYIHDPADRPLLKKRWSDMKEGWDNRLWWYTMVIPHAQTNTSPVSLYVLGEKAEVPSVRFFSPLDPNYDYSYPRIVFSWYDEKDIEKWGFVGHNGEAWPDYFVSTIPDNYSLKLVPAVANTSQGALNVRVDWGITSKSGGATELSGNTEVSVASGAVKNVHFAAAQLASLTPGDYVLNVEASNTASPYNTYDSFSLDLTTEHGLVLTGAADSTGAKLSWSDQWTNGLNPDSFQVVKIKSGALWTVAQSTSGTSYTDADHTQAATAETYAVIGKVDGNKAVIASNLVSVDPYQDTTANCEPEDVVGRWLFKYYQYDPATGLCEPDPFFEPLRHLEADGSIRDHWLGTIDGYWWEIKNGELYYYTETVPDPNEDLIYHGKLSQDCRTVSNGVVENAYSSGCWTATRD